MKNILLGVLFVMITCKLWAQEPHIDVKKRIKRGQTLKYTFVNQSQKSIYLFDPIQIIIEKKKNNDWVLLETPYCPCGRACPSPPMVVEVTAKGKVLLEWNLTESLCENNEEKKRIVEKGMYRVVFYYGDNQQERKKIVGNFKIR
ncbi:MAG: hypothetical protein MUC49_17260 [Raineya sp.]|nr:hypothetical protein [Raineya sp.]